MCHCIGRRAFDNTLSHTCGIACAAWETLILVCPSGEMRLDFQIKRREPRKFKYCDLLARFLMPKRPHRPSLFTQIRTQPIFKLLSRGLIMLVKSVNNKNRTGSPEKKVSKRILSATRKQFQVMISHQASDVLFCSRIGTRSGMILVCQEPILPANSFCRW